MLWTSVFSLSCILAVPDGAGPETAPSVLRAVLGDSLDAFGSEFYERADVYFHRGVEHIRAEAFEDGWFQRLGESISPTRHAHLHGEDVREIMPWLRFATQANPHNVEAYLVAAFWLAGEAGRPDLALEVLVEAHEHNARDYRIALEMGRVHARLGQMERAGRQFDAAMSLWPGEESPDSVDALFGKREILLHQAMIDEVRGNRGAAIAKLEDILKMFPRQNGFRDRIEELRRGDAPSVLASAILTDMLGDSVENPFGCSHGESEQHAEHAQQHQCDDDVCRDGSHGGNGVIDVP